jgi:hypothetical protein
MWVHMVCMHHETEAVARGILAADDVSAGSCDNCRPTPLMVNRCLWMLAWKLTSTDTHESHAHVAFEDSLSILRYRQSVLRGKNAFERV